MEATPKQQPVAEGHDRVPATGDGGSDRLASNADPPNSVTSHDPEADTPECNLS